MKQDRDELKIEDIYSFLCDASQINETAETKLSTTTSFLEKYLSQQKEINKKALPIAILFTIFLIVVMVGGAYCAMRMFELQSEKELTDQLIIKNEFGGYTYRTKNNHPVSYQELMSECDSLRKETYLIKEKLYSFAISASETGAVTIDYDSWTCQSNQIWLNAQEVVTDKEGNYLIYESSDGKIVTFEEIMSERDSLYNLLDCFKYKLSLVEQKYEIKFVESSGSVYMKSEKVDSALLLLPYYRDRITRTENGCWGVYVYENK